MYCKHMQQHHTREPDVYIFDLAEIRDKTGNINLQIKDGVTMLISQAVTPTATWTKFSVTGTFGASPAANVVVVINPIDTTAGITTSMVHSWKSGHPQRRPLSQQL